MPSSSSTVVDTRAKESTATTSSKGSAIAELRPSAEELYALQKLRIQRELEDDIIKWVQTRFWIIAIITVVIGFFGVRALVREFIAAELKEAMRASAEAQAAAQSARESIKEVRTEAGKYKDLVESASSTATVVNERLEELRSRIDAEGARSVAAADLKVSALDKQVEELRKTVTSLAGDSERTREILKHAESRIARAREAAQTSEAEFSSNANIKINVVRHDKDELSVKLAKEITASLTQKGFKTSESTWASSVPIGRNIRIAYQPIAKNKINVIEDAVGAVFRDKNLHTKLKSQEEEKPISNNPNYQVVIFFEKH
jgi:hypothetical protein